MIKSNNRNSTTRKKTMIIEIWKDEKWQSYGKQFIVEKGRTLQVVLSKVLIFLYPITQLIKLADFWSILNTKLAKKLQEYPFILN